MDFDGDGNGKSNAAGGDADGKAKASHRSKIPQNLLFKCPRCGNVIFMEEFNAGLKVCPGCSYHARISCQERLELTVDRGSFVEYDEGLSTLNPLEFPGYEEKVADAPGKNWPSRGCHHRGMYHPHTEMCDHHYGFPVYDGVDGLGCR